MTRSQTRLVGAVLVMLAVLPAAAVRAMDRFVALPYVYENGCVTKIFIRPLDVDSTHPKNVYFTDTSHRLRLGSSRVIWRLVPLDEAADSNVAWSIKKEASSYPICEDAYTFNGTSAVCNASNYLLGESYWRYTVLATKRGCDPALVDPEIIFKTGSDFLPRLFSAIAILLGLLGAVFLVLRRQRVSTP